MPSLSFKKRFAPKVLWKRKRQTIRNPRKVPIMPGDTLYLFSGLRTKYVQRLITVVCKSVYPITIRFNKGEIIEHVQSGDVITDTLAGLNRFARLDGFKDFEDMKAFWIAEHGVKKGKRKVILKPYKGILIKW